MNLLIESLGAERRGSFLVPPGARHAGTASDPSSLWSPLHVRSSPLILWLRWPRLWLVKLTSTNSPFGKCRGMARQIASLLSSHGRDKGLKRHLRRTLKVFLGLGRDILAWRIPGTEEPGGLPSMGSHRVGHCAEPSRVPRGPANSTAFLPSQRHPGKFPIVPCRSRGPPDKDLESPSSTRLEALVPSRDSRARTRSPSLGPSQ